MANWNQAKLTNIGRQKIAEAEARGLSLNITNLSTSSHDYSTSDIRSLTELSDIKQTISISEKSVEDTTIKLVGNIDNTNLENGYIFRTYGIFANIGESDFLLLVVTSENSDDIPSKYESIWQTIINSYIPIEEASNIEIVVNPSANATKQYVHDYLNGTKLITIETTGWSEETDAGSKPYYSKTFNVDGILASDTPTAMIYSNGAINTTTRKAIQKDYNNFFDYECGNGTYKILSYKIPTNQFIIALKGIGG